MLEVHWQGRITEYCDLLKLRWYHNPDSRRSNSGFPDLVILGPKGLLFAELKTDTGKMSADQKSWYEELAMVGVEAHVWRPADWSDVEQRLRQLAGK